MRSEKVIREKLKSKTELLNWLPKDAEYQHEYQKGYIQALYWVLNETV